VWVLEASYSGEQLSEQHGCKSKVFDGDRHRVCMRQSGKALYQ
jgi:hypothetical protein